MTEFLALWAIASFFFIVKFRCIALPGKIRLGELSFWNLTGAFLLFFSLQAVVLPLFYAAVYHTPPTTNGFALFNNVSIAASVGCLLIFTLFLKLSVRQQIWGTGNKFFGVRAGIFTWFLVFPLVAFVSHGSTEAIAWYFGAPVEEYKQETVQYLERLLEHPYLFWMTAMSLAVIVPIGEELLFRGFLYNWFKNVMRRDFAIILTALLFAVIHYSTAQGVANLVILPPLFVLAWALTFLYEKTETLFAPIALHMTFNGVSIFMVYSQ